uniref:Alkyl transferase n=1 Tax=Blastobotrys adeninivorans TaxID=409370 RepID=A0A060T685_BLAAD
MSGLIKWVVNFPAPQYASSFFQEVMVKVLRTGPLPRHIAFVMDGNRRFAKKNNIPLREGHVAGFDSLLHILEFCNQLGVEVITVYAFSIENFNRPKKEVDTLMDLVRSKIVDISGQSDFARKTDIRIRVLGDRSLLDRDILDAIEKAESSTKENSGMVVNVCFPYTTRNDITHAIRNLAEKVHNNALEIDGIDVDAFQKELYTTNNPPLDILVRTSGATRLSDFMLWECNTNCHIEIVDELWPDFGVWDLYRIIIKWSYQRTLEFKNLEVIQAKRLLPPPPPVVSVTEVEKARAIQAPN